jgi:hypothetical protein
MTAAPNTTMRADTAPRRKIPSFVRDDPWRYAFLFHWITLAFAAGFLSWADRHQWFNGDQWDFLVHRGISIDGVFSPHNGHWVSFGVLLYRTLFTLFGVTTYAPYLAVVIVAHLILAHLLWRLLRRMDVDPLLATGAVGLFAVLGVGWENLTSAFQYQFFVPLIFLVGALLVLGDVGIPTRRQRFLGALLLVFSLPWSSLSLVGLLVVGACALVRWGIRVALLLVTPALAVYLVWYAAERSRIQSAGKQPIGVALQAAPAFVWRGLVDASDHAVGFAGIGPVLLVFLALFVLYRSTQIVGLWPDAIILAAGAALFLASTALGRSGLGIATAGSPRYSYVVIALLLPAGIVAISPALGRGPARIPAATVLGVVLLVVQLFTFNNAARMYARIEQTQKRRIAATAALLRGGAKTNQDKPVPDFIPDLTVADVSRLDREGDLPGNLHLTEKDLLTAQVWVQFAISSTPPAPGAPPHLVATTDASVEPAAPGCAVVTGSGAAPNLLLRLDATGRARLRPNQDVSITARFEHGHDRGDSRTFALSGDHIAWLSVATKADLRLTIPFDRSLVLCGLG